MIPDEIKDLLTEACSLEYCPVEFREWAVATLSTGSASTLIKMPDARWRNIRINLYWAMLYTYPHELSRHAQHVEGARAALDTIKRDHDNPRTKSTDH